MNGKAGDLVPVSDDKLISLDQILYDNTPVTHIHIASIHFGLDDGKYGNLTLPKEIVDGFVNGNREVNLSFSFHEEPPQAPL